MKMPIFDHCLILQNDYFTWFKLAIAQQAVLLVLVLLLLLKDNHRWPRGDWNLNVSDWPVLFQQYFILSAHLIN